MVIHTCATVSQALKRFNKPCFQQKLSQSSTLLPAATKPCMFTWCLCLSCAYCKASPLVAVTPFPTMAFSLGWQALQIITQISDLCRLGEIIIAKPSDFFHTGKPTLKLWVSGCRKIICCLSITVSSLANSCSNF